MSLTMARPVHIPVLVAEVIEALKVMPGSNYVDGTVGLGGHAAAILNHSPGAKVLGIDADPKAIEIASFSLERHRSSLILVNDSYTNLAELCARYNFLPVNGILFDLGLSSFQLDTVERGFSFQKESALDMRFDPDQEKTAATIVNNYEEAEIAAILKAYGEERFSRRIARAIVLNRPIRTTLELAAIVERAYGGGQRRIHPATRTFQALRIAVNRELENLKAALVQAVDILAPHGRLVVIGYHSLEDRIVKHFMQQEARGCICATEIPICRCGHTPRINIVTRKVITPSLPEVALNPRSRSAKLRAAERL